MSHVSGIQRQREATRGNERPPGREPAVDWSTHTHTRSHKCMYTCQHTQTCACTHANIPPPVRMTCRLGCDTGRALGCGGGGERDTRSLSTHANTPPPVRVTCCWAAIPEEPWDGGQDPQFVSVFQGRHFVLSRCYLLGGSLAARENRLGRALACDVRPGFRVQGLGFGVCAMPPGFRV